MGDNKQPQNGFPNDLEDDLAGDWESAFQADDFTFSPQGEDDFFLGDETEFATSQASPYDFTPPTGKELEDLPDLDVDIFTQDFDESSVGTPDAAAVAEGEFTNGAYPAQSGLTSLYHSAKLAFLLLPLTRKIFAGIAVIALITLPLLFHNSETTAPETTTPEIVASATVEDTPLEVSPPDAVVEKEVVPEVQEIPEVREKIRVKWKFPAFIIPAPVREETPRKTNFVQTDITLILLVNDGEDPPTDKEIVIRDVIYQFFSNQSLTELRRFALARGDMNRSLRSWIQKQWPDAPVETIIFDRYQII